MRRVLLVIALLVGCTEENGTSDATGFADALVFSDAAADGGTNDDAASLDADLDAGQDDGGVDPCRPLDPEFVDAIDVAVEEVRTRAQSPGVILRIAVDCRGEHSIAAGEAVFDPSAPMRTDHTTRIGSITKGMVAAMMLSLEEDGMLSLDDPIDLYIDNIPNGDLITIRHLLNHSSGLFNYTEDAAFVERIFNNELPIPVDPRLIVETATASPPYFAPGEGWHYSNTNYIVAGLITEVVTSTTFHAALRARVLEPLGMEETYLDPYEPPIGELAHGYDRSITGWLDSTPIDLSWAWSAGGIASTASDLTLWYGGLFRGDLLAQGSLDEMLVVVPGSNYGLGVGVFNTPSGRVFSHSGAVPGYNTGIAYYEGYHLTVVMILNTGTSDFDAGWGRVLELIDSYQP